MHEIRRFVSKFGNVIMIWVYRLETSASKVADFNRAEVNFPVSITGTNFDETGFNNQKTKSECPHVLKFCIRYVNQQDQKELASIDGVNAGGAPRFVGYSRCPTTDTWFIHDGATVAPVSYTSHVKDKPMIAFIYERADRF